MELELAEDELKNLGKVWALVFASLSYCFFIDKFKPKGFIRFLSIFPVIILFLTLPLHLTSIHFLGITSFFISWLANFKLILFTLNKGPLSPSANGPPISLIKFVAVACLPIKIIPRQNPSHDRSNKTSPLSYLIKASLLVLIINTYEYSNQIHPKIISLLYVVHVYLILELILAAVAKAAKLFLSLELEPQFYEPLFSTSLQDFWGKRWNIMVTSILRPTVYQPMVYICTQIIGVPRIWAPVPGIVAVFLVSGLMHELMFFHLGMGRVRPTFELTWFFLLNGVCLCVELYVKKVMINGMEVWRWLRVAYGAVSVGFVVATGFWLFLPPLLRCNADVRAFEEYAASGRFVTNIVILLTSFF